MGLQHLQHIREYELDQVRELIPLGSRILEVGSGAGWQALQLTKSGHSVFAIDLPQSNYATVRVFPTVLYDGLHIPAAAQSFDVVFSSNVLEHVVHLEALLGEFHRVLKTNGFAIHVLPTPSWRLWTGCVHYPTMMRQSGARGLWRRPLPERHGVRGNLISETYYFSRAFWEKEFQRHGWQVVRYYPNGLFYTGYCFLDARLPIEQRTYLARVLGSACGIFVLSGR